MLKSYIKLAFRNLVKNKMAAVINLTGLSTAIGCSMVAYAVFNYHYNRDSFHTNGQRIFMIKNVVTSNKAEQVWGNAPLPLGPALKRDFPQVKRAVRWAAAGATVRHNDNVFQENVQFVGEDFLQMFTFRLKYGDQTALSDRNGIVLTEETSVKYFGETNPVGNKLDVTFPGRGKMPFIVRGVTEKISRNSSIRFNILFPYQARPDLEPQDHTDWSMITGATFVELDNADGIATVSSGAERYLELQNIASPDRKMVAWHFEPLSTVSENSSRTNASITGTGVVASQLYGLFFQGLFLLLLACFNYMNISISSAARRLKEIGIRKVMGGSRNELVKQFLGENLVLCLIASILGIALGKFVLVPGFDNLFPGPRIFEVDLLGDMRLWIFILSMLILTSLGSGAYPALYISSFQIVTIFRNKVKLSGSGRFTQILLIFQFVLSFILIVLCLASVQNNTYQRNRDWGYNQEQILVIPLHESAQFQELKNAVARHPNVRAVAGASTHIGRSSGRRGIEILDERYDITAFEMGYDYIEAMGLELQSGRSFDRQMPTDLEQAVIVNEALVNMMQWQEPIGQRIKQHGSDLAVIGVAKDFHYRPVGMFKVEPALLTLTDESEFKQLVVAVNPGTSVRTSNDLREIWRSLYPEIPYNGYFQDTIWDGFTQLLSGIDKSSAVLSLIVLLLSCMGILGLVSMNIAKRIREISIRKVLGASVMSIANLIGRHFVILFGIASVLALPAAYFLTKMMLDGFFKDHQGLDLSPFYMAFSVVLVATVGTIASQLYKAIVINPAIALRNE